MINYKDLNFKSGIEIHQQIESKKLFCDCPGIIDDSKPDFIVKRKLRAVAGELDEIDVAAEYEVSKNKEIIYQGTKTSSCLIELDEEPVKLLNYEALITALQISLLLKSKPVDEIQVMRKTVVDGSNTSGFQRTALISTGGFIQTSKGRVRISYINLEEEAARRISSDEESITFNLDRLGIPLVEIGTEPDIKDNEHALEVASTIGMILRSTNKVKRGLGTIRQDVNLSINNHPRIELKGFQDLKSIPKVIENEVNRMLEEMKGKVEIKQHVRKVNKDLTSSYLRPMPGAARLYPETDIPTIKITEEMLKKIELPELISEKVLKLRKKYNLNYQLAKEIIDEDIDFNYYAEKFMNISSDFLARTLVETPKEIKSRYKVKKDKLNKSDFQEALSLLNVNEITKEAVFDILVNKFQRKKINLKNYKGVSIDDAEEEVEKLVKKKKDLSENALMGLLMKEYRGKISGKRLMELIKEYKE